jgi:hypothetical protein
MRDIRPNTPKPKSFVPPEMIDALPVVPKRLPGASVPVTSVHVPRAKHHKQPAAAAVPTQKPARPLFAPKEVFVGKKRTPTRLGHKERSIVLALLALVIIAGGLATYMFLPKASIKLVLATAPLLVDQQLTLQANAAADANSIPGTAFMREVKVEGDSPVASTEVIGTKTKGEVVVINRTLDEQKIKEGSRLVTDDGKLYYMLKPAFVPAGETSSTAASTVTVEAAEAGPQYNIGKQRLNFAALDKASQSLVYAEVRVPLTGGSGDTVKVVKDADIDQAKKAAGEEARAEAEQDIRKQLPSGWVILDESWQETAGDFAADKKVDDKADNLHYSATETVRVMAYEQKSLEDRLKTALEAKLDKDYMLFPGQISYTKSVKDVNWDQSQGTIAVRVTHTTIPRISLDALRDKLSGLDASQAQIYLSGLPGVKSASVNLWPFWAYSVPRIQNRVQIDLQSDHS